MSFSGVLPRYEATKNLNLKMMTEYGYYFTHMVSALTFLKDMKAENLAVDPQFFHK